MLDFGLNKNQQNETLIKPITPMFRENIATIKNVNIFILHNATVVDLVANASFIFVEREGKTFCLWVYGFLEWDCTSCTVQYPARTSPKS